MFVKNCWYVAAWDYELAADQIITRMIIDEPVVLYRTDDGAIVGLEDRCCHRFAPLSLGRLEGNNLRCMYHGLKFDPSGTCIEIPGQDRIPPQAKVRRFPVVERDSWIWVWMGDPARADADLIPSAVGFADPKWTLRSGQMDYDANYLLINDNLTDFSHLSYTHANSFGATEVFARTRPKITRLDRGIRVQRWVRDGFKADGKLTETAMRGSDIAIWQTYDYLAPGILLMLSANYPASLMPEDGFTPPTSEPLAANFTSQAVTPLTEHSSRYFFSWGPLAGEGSDAQADIMMTIANLAFNEDKTMIEAQQKVIDRKPGKEILTSADVGPVQMRQVIAQLMAGDAGPARTSEAAE